MNKGLGVQRLTPKKSMVLSPKKTTSKNTSSNSSSSAVSAEQLLRHRELFDLFDCDHDGSISKNDLSIILSSIGEDTSDKYINEMMNEMKQDGAQNSNISITFQQFSSKMMELKYEEIQSQLLDVFDIYDEETMGDAQGYINIDKLQPLLSKLGNPFSNSDIQQLKKDSVDEENKNRLRVEPLLGAMMKKIRELNHTQIEQLVGKANMYQKMSNDQNIAINGLENEKTQLQQRIDALELQMMENTNSYNQDIQQKIDEEQKIRTTLEDLKLQLGDQQKQQKSEESNNSIILSSSSSKSIFSIAIEKLLSIFSSKKSTEQSTESNESNESKLQSTTTENDQKMNDNDESGSNQQQ